MEILIAAVTLGFLGSFHCIGMCGPIALALPVHQLSRFNRIVSVLAYNFGRIVTYAAFGAVFGVIGQSLSFFGYQQILSIILGVLILVGLVIPVKWLNKSAVFNRFYQLFFKLKSHFNTLFNRKGILVFFSIGLLNGLLPCGFVYLGIAGAIASGSVLSGALFMASFGAGTIPFMLGIGLSSHLITLKARNALRKAVPVMVGVMAVLLILRGMNLGIRFISPQHTIEESCGKSPNETLECCHKK